MRQTAADIAAAQAAAGTAAGQQAARSGGGSSGTGARDGRSGQAYAEAEGSRGEDQADWARLRDRVRRHGINAEGHEHFNEEDQEVIRAYFRRLHRAQREAEGEEDR